jgi:hypothetical protein
VLGELFEGKPLRELLMEAVLYGDDPKHKQKLFTAVDGVVDKQKIETLIRERKLTSEGLDPRTVTEIREKMERAGARRLQPHYIRAFFEKAFVRLGGQIRRRETGRYEITRVPGRLRDRDRFAGGVVPIAERYPIRQTSSRVRSRMQSFGPLSTAKIQKMARSNLTCSISLIITRRCSCHCSGACYHCRSTREHSRPPKLFIPQSKRCVLL